MSRWRGYLNFLAWSGWSEHQLSQWPGVQGFRCLQRSCFGLRCSNCVFNIFHWFLLDIYVLWFLPPERCVNNLSFVTKFSKLINRYYFVIHLFTRIFVIFDHIFLTRHPQQCHDTQPCIALPYSTLHWLLQNNIPGDNWVRDVVRKQKGCPWYSNYTRDGLSLSNPRTQLGVITRLPSQSHASSHYTRPNAAR